MNNTLKNTLSYILGAILVFSFVALAGTLTPGGNTSTPTMYTLSDIYNKLTIPSYTPPAHTVSTSSSPTTGTFNTLSEIYSAIPAFLTGDTSNATSTRSDTTLTLTIPRGISDGTATLSTSSANLTAGNIKDDVIIFGVEGTYAGAGAPALVWEAGPGTNMNWNAGTAYCGGLSTDQAIVWRLPSVTELSTAYTSGVPGSFEEDNYWSGTTFSDIPTSAYVFYMYMGNVWDDSKTVPYYVRCVH